MDEQQYKIWVAQLSALTKNQMSDALSRFKLLSTVGVINDNGNGKSDFGERVLGAICITMKKNKVEVSSVNVLRKSSAYVSSREKLVNLQIFFESISKSKMVQDQILKEAINLLYHDLLRWEISISAHTILQQVHRLPSSLNHAFPGYLQSGLLTKIIKGQ